MNRRHVRRRRGSSAANPFSTRTLIPVERLEERRLLAARIWDGGGDDDNWSTAANWVDDDAPPSDGTATLDFGAPGALRKGNVNNYPDGTQFARITFSDNGYTLTGNRITLRDDVNAAEGAGSNRLELDGSVTVVRDDVSISNGPAWSPDGRTMYLDDSGRSVLLAYDVDPSSGDLSGERVLVEFAQGAGDGLAVDDEGHLWVAVFGGSAVHRYDPAGRLDFPQGVRG